MDALLLVNGITLLVMGALAALLFWLGGGSFSFRRLIAGKDGGLSTSKFQATLWSIIALAAFVAVYVAHMLKRQYAPTVELPANLAALAGLSLVTYVGAGMITGSKVANEAVSLRARGVDGAVPSKATANTGSVGDLLNDDDNETDLAKVQLILWTVVGVLTFVIGLEARLGEFLGTWVMPGGAPPPTTIDFPEVNTTLLTLTGLSSATYLGKKAFFEKPRASMTEYQPMVVPDRAMVEEQSTSAQRNETQRTSAGIKNGPPAVRTPGKSRVHPTQIGKRE